MLGKTVGTTSDIPATGEVGVYNVGLLVGPLGSSVSVSVMVVPADGTDDGLPHGAVEGPRPSVVACDGICVAIWVVGSIVGNGVGAVCCGSEIFPCISTPSASAMHSASHV